MFIEQLVPTPKHPTVGEKYDARTETALMLIDQGFAKEAVRPPRELSVQFAVTRNELTGVVELHATCSRSCGSYTFSGSPDLLRLPKFAYFHGCSAPEPTPVPQAVIERYREMREGAQLDPITTEKTDEISYEQALILSNRETKRIDGQRLDRQIAREHAQAKKMGW